MSISNKIVCASCHQQNFAFGDTFVASHGVYGALSSRHSMRLINNRFQVETKFFWDERAISLENQIPQTKENFNEMGYSGTGGRQDINALILKLNGIDYYKLLFSFVYRESLVAIPRLQESIAHFIRSI